MKDVIQCDEDVAFKDVVVIGNGPSGIVLSFILSGNWPYYNGGSHPDEMLMARLQSVPKSASLLEQDLQFLSQGLEGRSRNPVAVLVDSLIRPYGSQITNDSSLLSWKRHPEKLIDHVVIGKGKPGGCWQNLDGNLTAVSVNSWMELPGLSFSQWENTVNNANMKCLCKDNRSPPKRVKTKQVAKYYRDYVEHTRLSKNFRNFSCVTSVKPVTSIDTYDFLLTSDINRSSHFWEVKGFDTIRKKYFCYVCRNVVLANGTYDDNNLLNIPGELSHPDWVFHDLKQFRNAVVDLKKNHSADVDPVLIVGSGLTAADAILTCRQFDLPVLHVFNTFSELNDNKLPKNMYPEYDLVYRMMKRSNELERNYTPLYQYTVSAISQSIKARSVLMKCPEGQDNQYAVSLVAIMIGCLPDLSFLAAEFESGKKLGVEKDQRIHCRRNPIRISPWSYEVTNSTAGLYAMGPLVGDNVIRVIPGGAVAIASHLLCKDGVK